MGVDCSTTRGLVRELANCIFMGVLELSLFAPLFSNHYDD